MKKHVELKQDHAGQWMYRVVIPVDQLPHVDARSVIVDWQHGPFNRDECVEQARERFGRDLQEATK